MTVSATAPGHEALSHLPPGREETARRFTPRRRSSDDGRIRATGFVTAPQAGLQIDAQQMMLALRGIAPPGFGSKLGATTPRDTASQ